MDDTDSKKLEDQGIDSAHVRLAKMMNTDAERLSHCEYYLFAGIIPVCFLVSRQGNHYGARRPGDEPGSLTPDATLMSKLAFDGSEFDRIGEEEFRQRVRDYVRRPPVVDRGR